MAEQFYHGGPCGLALGDMVLPPSATGAKTAVHGASQGVKRKYRKDRVYVTPDPKFALFFAARHDAGVVYEVEPIGEVEPTHIGNWCIQKARAMGKRSNAIVPASSVS